MKTSSWLTVGAMPGRIGISVGSPRGQPAGYRFYRPLAPERAWLHEPLEVYRPLYQAKLAALDPQKVWDDIHALAGKDADGRQIEPVLLCFEVPPWTATNWCHRRLAAAYLQERLGVTVPELGFAGSGA